MLSNEFRRRVVTGDIRKTCFIPLIVFLFVLIANWIKKDGMIVIPILSFLLSNSKTRDMDRKLLFYI